MAEFAPMPPVSAEDVLRAAEGGLGLTITVRDLTGWLRGPDGLSVIPAERNSHRRLAACNVGFAPACVAHCRHACTATLRASGRPHATACWKGVREVLVPVIRSGMLHGYLFAGAWRTGDGPAGPWSAARDRLPAWDPEHAATAIATLTGVADCLWSMAERARSGPDPADRAGRIRAYLTANPARGRAGLARHLGLSASRTSHLVRELCACSVQELVIDTRIAAAQRMLSDSDLPVSEIGRRVGWSDAPHFARMFRQRVGLPPARWRDGYRAV